MLMFIIEVSILTIALNTEYKLRLVEMSLVVTKVEQGMNRHFDLMTV